MRAVRLLFPAVALIAVSTLSAQRLPSDARPACVATSMSSWFQSGHITANGAVEPANSLSLDATSNCDFHLWAQQMFLWLTSPAPPGYGGAGRVFDSDLFYEVTEPVNGKRYFVPQIVLPQDAPLTAQARKVHLRSGKPERAKVIEGVLDISAGQAGGGGVLLAQNGSAVYYSIVANDVYAYFASGVKSGAIKATRFPTTQPELDTIQRFAGRAFADGNALAVEVKMSWVDISAVQSPSSYITTPAIVPVYDMSDPALWKSTGTKLTTLALVGVHFVGSVNGHPEMVWSTFEHAGNTPTGAYQYINDRNQIVSVPADSAGTWLFSKPRSNGPFNVMRAIYDQPPDIRSAPGDAIGPSDTQRVYPFGVPDQNDPTAAALNTEVISANNSVRGQLASGDVRANYSLVGSTFLSGGSARGTSFLANSTMETYHQASAGTPGSNCFSCHNAGGGSSAPATTAVSHIFHFMEPFTPPLPAGKPRSGPNAR